ncbi:hypothetical protein EDB19DRAFT_1934362 [Suillus lakei]|nr:hypothetical protein EDB19DRAFT_1934362 [Suillus lakei]
MSKKGLFLRDLPYDIRILIYEAILANHQCVKQNNQPSNAHIRILHTCRQIFYEAHAIFHKYVSLRNDWEVDHYLTYLDSEPKAAPVVRWADVANDGRVLENAWPVPHPRHQLNFEGAMFPGGKGHKPLLLAYELHLDPSTRANPFQTLAFKSHPLSAFIGRLFFIHAQGHRLGFEIRNVHLESLLAGPGSRLRKLVLLGSSRLSSGTIASCLHSLPTLEYLALSLVTVNELRENFILALGPLLQVLKLQITHAWYAVPLFEEERIICDALEERILLRYSPHTVMHVSFHSQLMAEDGRQDRWKKIAAAQHISLKIGPWEDEEET